MGVILWYQVEFPDQSLTLSSDVYSGKWLVDASITVKYGIGEPGSFEARFKDLPYDVHKSVSEAQAKKDKGDGVKIVIRLGYLDDLGSKKRSVLEGRVSEIKYAKDFPPLGVLITGYEEAAFKLVNTQAVNGEDPKAVKMAHIAGKDESPAYLAGRIVKGAGLGDLGNKSTADPTDKKDSYNRDAENAFNLLELLAADVGAEVLVQEGKVQFGTAIKFPPEGPFPSPPPNPSALLAFLTGDDSLITVKDLEGARLAEFRPLLFGSTSKQRVVSDLPAKSDVKAFDFIALGVPSMRAGQMVIASVEGYEKPFDPFRILNVTHSFSLSTGYVCTGRAVVFNKDGGNRGNSEKARQASAPAIADRIKGVVKDAQVSFPSIDVGRVKASQPDKRLATLYYRPDRAAGAVSPSVQMDVPKGDAVLLSKPMASPFAWHKVGLSVPVYEGMRALLNQVRDSRDDTVVTGYLWAQTPAMDPPKAHDGDWWLCLPTELGGDPKLPVNHTVNDLTAADGRRVIEAVGLQITVGKDACSKVGGRPEPGSADVFLIKHKSGSSIQIDDQGNVDIKVGGTTLSVGKDGVSIS
jgi:hypothetical protein